MKSSNLFTINWNDILKGLLMAVLTPVVFLIEQTVQNGDLIFNWKQIGAAAASGGLAYIAKNFFTPATPIKTEIKDSAGSVTNTVITTDEVKVEVPAPAPVVPKVLKTNAGKS